MKVFLGQGSPKSTSSGCFTVAMCAVDVKSFLSNFSRLRSGACSFLLITLFSPVVLGKIRYTYRGVGEEGGGGGGKEGEYR